MAIKPYTITQVAPGLITTIDQFGKYGKQLWNKSKLRRRAGDLCVICGIAVNGEAYRPMTNKKNRQARMCVFCAEGIHKYDRG